MMARCECGSTSINDGCFEGGGGAGWGGTPLKASRRRAAPGVSYVPSTVSAAAAAAAAVEGEEKEEGGEEEEEDGKDDDDGNVGVAVAVVVDVAVRHCRSRLYICSATMAALRAGFAPRANGDML